MPDTRDELVRRCLRRGRDRAIRCLRRQGESWVPGWLIWARWLVSMRDRRVVLPLATSRQSRRVVERRSGQIRREGIRGWRRAGWRFVCGQEHGMRTRWRHRRRDPLRDVDGGHGLSHIVSSVIRIDEGELAVEQQAPSTHAIVKRAAHRLQDKRQPVSNARGQLVNQRLCWGAASEVGHFDDERRGSGRRG